MFAQSFKDKQVGLLGISKNFSKKHSKFFFLTFKSAFENITKCLFFFFFFVLKTLKSVFKYRKNFKKHCQTGPKSNYFINH